ncbi:MAG TPA: LysR family transcriptional regulator, partial [Polyangiales bacterium]
MDYNDVPLFVHVVEAGGFSAAARALGREKSAVSRGVARLEQELGVRLLQRTTRKLALTDAGQAFYQRARLAVAGVDEAASEVRELGSEPRGVVRMTAPMDTQTLQLASTIARFVAKYPKIHVELTLTGQALDLVERGIDLAVRAGKLVDSTLVAKRVGASEMRLFASPGYLRRAGTPKRVEQLKQHVCVLYRPRTPGRASWVFGGPHGDESVDVRGAVAADDMTFVAQAAVAGAGIALLPLELARHYVEQRQLTLVLPEHGVDGGAVYLVMPSASFVPARVLLLREFLFEA